MPDGVHHDAHQRRARLRPDAPPDCSLTRPRRGSAAPGVRGSSADALVRRSRGAAQRRGQARAQHAGTAPLSAQQRGQTRATRRVGSTLRDPERLAGAAARRASPGGHLMTDHARSSARAVRRRACLGLSSRRLRARHGPAAARRQRRATPGGTVIKTGGEQRHRDERSPGHPLWARLHGGVRQRHRGLAWARSPGRLGVPRRRAAGARGRGPQRPRDRHTTGTARFEVGAGAATLTVEIFGTGTGPSRARRGDNGGAGVHRRGESFTSGTVVTLSVLPAGWNAQPSHLTNRGTSSSTTARQRSASGVPGRRGWPGSSWTASGLPWAAACSPRPSWPSWPATCSADGRPRRGAEGRRHDPALAGIRRGPVARGVDEPVRRGRRRHRGRTSWPSRLSTIVRTFPGPSPPRSATRRRSCSAGCTGASSASSRR